MYAEENMQPGNSTVIYRRGTVAMAKMQAPATTGSQFFFSVKDNQLSGDSTSFGTVVRGMEVIDRVAAAGVTGGEDDVPPAFPLQILKVSLKDIR